MSRLLQLIFLYKLIHGVAESSFGTHVANLAGVPLDVVKRADLISKDFAKQFKEKLQIKQEQSASSKMPSLLTPTLLICSSWVLVD